MEEPPAAAGSTPHRVRVATVADLPASLAELGLRGPRPVVVLVGGADRLDDARLAGLRALFEDGLVPVVDALGAASWTGAPTPG